MDESQSNALLVLFKEHNTILHQIAETLDTLAMGQDTATQTLDELVDIATDISQILEQPITSGEMIPNLPGFDGDPLANFPTIRKDTDNGTSN